MLQPRKSYKSKQITRTREKNSQTAALLLLAGALLTAFVVVSVQRCCYQREFGTLPSPYQYEKLESEAAVEAFKLNMEKLAKGQGKRRADMCFATMNKKNPSDILKSAYENLVAVNKFDEAFPSLEDYQELQAQAVMGISRDDRVSKTELLRRANMPCIKALVMKPKLRGLDMWFERTTRASRRWSSSLTWLPVRVALDTH